MCGGEGGEGGVVRDLYVWGGEGCEGGVCMGRNVYGGDATKIDGHFGVLGWERGSGGGGSGARWRIV